MTTADSKKILGEEIVKYRAAMDGDPEYDAETDEEGYVVSCLNALHRLTVASGRNWEDELKRAQECFDQDEGELNTKTMVYRLLRDNQDKHSTRYHILDEDEVNALQTLLEDRT